MATEQDVQEVLNTLTNSITTASDKAFAESFSAAIAKHNAEAAVAAAAAATTSTSTPATTPATAASAVAVGPGSVETSHFNDQQQNDHDQLQRIAQQHRAEIEKENQGQQEHEQREQVPGQEQNTTQTTVGQDDEHQQVLQHIATAAAEANSTLATVPIMASSPQPPAGKPAPGSEEWHKIRRDNHKEVERRRRENINDGISDLAKMIPNCEKNKGLILRQAVKYIQDLLAENERFAGEAEQLVAAKLDVDKYVLEKNIAEATCQTLNVQHEQLKRQFEELRKKKEDFEEHTAKKQRTE
ncbi:basic helix-loop-helix protein [Dissophora ornata]|nr:basic helix-loop-helix protein [Dissophora ornata]